MVHHEMIHIEWSSAQVGGDQRREASRQRLQRQRCLMNLEASILFA